MRHLRDCTIRLSSRVRRIARDVRPHRGLIFCLSFQRTGTTSTGDFFEYYLKYRRRGWLHSDKNNWTRQWLDGRYDEIFASQDFQTGEMFEDDPWWIPGAHEVLYEYFPEADYILFERDADAWFASMLSHSIGKNPGYSDLHARIYARERDFEEVCQRNPNSSNSWSAIPMIQHGEHYKKIYNETNSNVRSFFQDRKYSRFFWARLEDPFKFEKLATFMGQQSQHVPEFHSDPAKRRTR